MVGHRALNDNVRYGHAEHRQPVHTLSARVSLSAMWGDTVTSEASDGDEVALARNVIVEGGGDLRVCKRLDDRLSVTSTHTYKGPEARRNMDDRR